LSPDTRQHRGAHPADAQLFAQSNLDRLRVAVSEMSWLLGRGYAMKSALKLVGDQHNLTERQRLAVARAVCTDEQRTSRSARSLPVQSIRNEHLLIDGFNLIITIEAALGGGVLLLCRDDCVRDLSSIHGSYRTVVETEKAINLIGAALEDFQPETVKWFLDRPVSNSGRLAQRIKETAAVNDWPWSVEVVFNPDADILASTGIAVTSDSLILDGTARWINLSRYLVEKQIAHSWVIDLKSNCETN
jgi:hypothetical protein